MNLNVSFNADRVLARLNGITKDLPKKIDRALAVTALEGINVIKERTKKGIGYKAIFRPYSSGYIKFRQAKGRKIAPVDLNFTGEMMGAISTRRVAQGIQRIYFTRAEAAQKAVYHNVLGAGRGKVKREFFGFSKKEKTRLGRIFRKRLVI